jgi:hypothetical protein
MNFKSVSLLIATVTSFAVISIIQTTSALSQVRKIRVQDQGARVITVPQQGVRVIGVQDQGARVITVPQQGVRVLGIQDQGARVITVPQQGVRVIKR